MAFSVDYDSSVGSYSIHDYLAEWSATFGDVNHTNGNVDDSNSGGFYGGALSGSQYAITSTANNITSFVAEGNLTYTLFADPAHTLYGSLDGLSFGDGLQGGSSSPYNIQALDVSFSGLGLSSAQSEGHDGIVHEVVYGLMSGDTSALETALNGILDQYNLSIDSTFDQIAAVVGSSATADHTDLLAA
ncbi:MULTISPECIES: heme acquisition protein HasA [Raoultella]|jgi:heme acquisition protein HasA|uniref:heme acquisition protein HasA n=1 Tax=Raoultella TaxID=160674 RepID=UPI00132FAADE|nr:heme acquisition protein HasA [Raoultella terrigena]MCI1032185.1 hemophore HasA [Raoultella terrigena]